MKSGKKARRQQTKKLYFTLSPFCSAALNVAVEDAAAAGVVVDANARTCLVR
jgi:hypothetical protein